LRQSRRTARRCSRSRIAHVRRRGIYSHDSVVRFGGQAGPLSGSKRPGVGERCNVRCRPSAVIDPLWRADCQEIISGHWNCRPTLTPGVCPRGLGEYPNWPISSERMVARSLLFPARRGASPWHGLRCDRLGSRCQCARSRSPRALQSYRPLCSERASPVSTLRRNAGPLPGRL
jgi:hypothetical protein